MKESDKSRIIERYHDRMQQYGDSVQALACGGKERQYLRFDILCGVGNLEGVSILDVGCGYGDLVTYLRERKIQFSRYLGVDINPELLEIAKKRHEKDERVSFKLADVTEQGFSDHFDYVLAGSVFNNKLEEGNMAFIKRALERLFALADKGVAVNFMTDYVDYKEPDIYYYSPEKIFSLCKAVTKQVALRHDYPLYDFTVYLYAGGGKGE